jgi:hypothetical protein
MVLLVDTFILRANFSETSGTFPSEESVKPMQPSNCMRGVLRRVNPPRGVGPPGVASGGQAVQAAP